MRVHAIRSTALAGLAALAALVSGCGSAPTGPELTVAFVGPSGGPLAARAADMRRAAQLELDAIKSRASGHPIRLVDGPDPQAVATIRAPSAPPIRSSGQLVVELSPPPRRITGGRQNDRIWLVPPRDTAERVTRDYRASGEPGATTATTDSPLRAGTPSGRYVTAALSEHSYPPVGSAFFKKFERQYERAPDRWAIYAYEATGLIVDAIARANAEGKDPTRSAVAKAALAIGNRFGPVGHYDILPSGQSTLYIFQARGAGAPDPPASLFESLR
jgi:ABC-type branched-subunit amino acid transport system substrate-binding protein